MKNASILLLLLTFFLVSQNIKTMANDSADPLFCVKIVTMMGNGIAAWPDSVPGDIIRNFAKIGIEVELEILSRNAYYPRVWNNEVGAYSEGGYDITIFSMGISSPTYYPGESLEMIYGSNAIPPSGYNFMYWAPGISAKDGKRFMNYRVNESNLLISEINTNVNLDEVKMLLFEWQKLWYDVLPHLVVYNELEINVISRGLFGYDPGPYFPTSSLENLFCSDDYAGTKGEVVIATHYLADTFNPIQDEVDEYVRMLVFDRLVGFTPSNKILMPSYLDPEEWMIEKFGTPDFLHLYPRLAETLGEYTANGSIYEIDVKNNLYFHDGHRLDAWDVAFSFQAGLQTEISNYYYDKYYPMFFGDDDKVNHHGNYSFVVTDEDNDTFYEHIMIYLNGTFPSFQTDILDRDIFPEHILGDPQTHGFDVDGNFNVNLWNVHPEEWQDHSTTTANPNDRGGYTGPIGCGSYVFYEYNTSNQTITFKKFENLYWNTTQGQWIDAPGVSFYNIEAIKDAPDTCRLIDFSEEDAIANMKAGNVNILDPKVYNSHYVIEELQTEEKTQVVFYPKDSWKGIFFNPKLEHGGVRHLDKKGVRHAISHIIPRENICSEVLHGSAIPAYSPFAPSSWGIIPQDQLIAYKQSLTASDGSKPLQNSANASDVYSNDVALDWLASEGYDVSPWRNETTSNTDFQSTIFLLERVLIAGVVYIGLGVTVLYIWMNKRKKY